MRRRRIIHSSFNFRFKITFSKIILNNFITDEDMKVDNIRISFQIACSQNNQHDYRHNHYHHLEDIFPRTRLRGTFDDREKEGDSETGEKAKAEGRRCNFARMSARMSDSREGRSRQTHPGGLGDENKLASEHQWWPCSVRFLSAEPKREVARLWLRLLRQKRRLTSLISDENENEFDPFFSLSPFLQL